MKLLICLLALSALASSVPSGPLQSHVKQQKKPLVGISGSHQLAHIQKYPYTVSTYSDFYKRISGNGVILNHYWIMTTVSQYFSQSVEDITVRGGSDDGQTEGQSSKIGTMITNYTGDYAIDIALLKTKNKLVFNKKLRPIRLAKKLPKVGTKASISGFGWNEIHGGMLSAGRLQISDYEECKNYYSSGTIFCAKSANCTPEWDDKGAPLVQKKQLIGFYSGDDGEKGLYTFMPISKLRKWIIQTIKNQSVADEADGIDNGHFDFEVAANDADKNEDEDDDDDDDDDDNDDDNDDDDDDDDDSAY